jgi:hypothetical protein
MDGSISPLAEFDYIVIISLKQLVLQLIRSAVFNLLSLDVSDTCVMPFSDNGAKSLP